MLAEKLLQQLGLSPNEIKTYLASLEMGVSSAQNIARKAGLKRTTAYSVLSYLVSRGLAGKTKAKGKTRFVAEPPDKLSLLISDLHEKAKKILPELEAIYNKNEVKPRILFFEGDQAIQNVYDDTLREKPEEILEWNTSAYFERFPEHDYINKRVKLGIKAKRIAGKGSIWQTKHKRRDPQELSETLIVPKESFDPKIEVNIYNNKLAIMNYADNTSLIIENKPITDAMRQAYELSWIGAKQKEVK